VSTVETNDTNGVRAIRPKDEVVFARDGFRCVYCGFDGREFDGWTFLQIDHFKPRSLGGTDHIDNLVTSCIVCNFMKGAKVWPTLEEARREIATWRSQMRQYWQQNVEPLIKRSDENAT
jgi:5-methylcytosine-specific restriction endonuclease McrA